MNPRFVQLFLPPNVVKARHALALHEYRVSFEVLLWTPPDARDQEPPDIVQMWFPGAHGDVGGGYLETDASNVSSSHALRWMKHEMWPDRWFGTDSLTNVWPIHDSSSGIFKRMAPKIRWSLTRAKAAQLRTMEISEWLQLGLRQGPKVVLCDDRATTPPALCAFRPVIAALHANVHDLARLAWLRVGLARAASKHSDGSIPPAYANPSAIEALEALSASASGFMRELNAAGVAVLATTASGPPVWHAYAATTSP
ncbi:T6SS phospholipase effector Tle1-like catalytic domain-containing protein [Roseateles sp. GG27B]